MRGRAPGRPALVVDGDGVERHVRVRVLDVAVEDGDVAAEPHRADPGLVQELEQLLLELRDVGVGFGPPIDTRIRSGSPSPSTSANAQPDENWCGAATPACRAMSATVPSPRVWER